MTARERLLKLAGQPKFQEVNVDGEIFTIRTLTPRERVEYDKEMIHTDRKGKTSFQYGKQRSLLVYMTLVESEQNPVNVFSSVKDLEDTVTNQAVLEKIFDASAILNRLVELDEDEKPKKD
jgi:hypothetical protein